MGIKMIENFTQFDAIKTVIVFFGILAISSGELS
jgi:hypothetical protein